MLTSLIPDVLEKLAKAAGGGFLGLVSASKFSPLDVKVCCIGGPDQV
jgi:hypothetical protein